MESEALSKREHARMLGTSCFDRGRSAHVSLGRAATKCMPMGGWMGSAMAAVLMADAAAYLLVMACPWVAVRRLGVRTN